MDPAAFRAFRLPLDMVAAFCARHGVAAPESVERIRKGEVSASFWLRLADRDEAVLKVYCRSQDPSWLVRDAASLSYLACYGEVPVPAWTRLDVSGEVIPFPALLMARVGGVDGDELLPADSHAREALLLRRCGATLAALHHTPLDQVGALMVQGLHPADAWAERTDAQFWAALGNLRQQGWMDPALLEAARETFERELPALHAPFEPVLLHRDYQLWNLRVDPISLDILGLLDFDAAGLGPREADVRDLELNLFIERPWLRREFWAGYGRPAPEGREAERLRLSSLVRAFSLLAAYWGPTSRVTPATVWLLLSPWTEDIEDISG